MKKIWKFWTFGYLFYFAGFVCFCSALFLPQLVDSQFFVVNKVTATEKLKVISLKQHKPKTPPKPKVSNICTDMEVDFGF